MDIKQAFAELGLPPQADQADARVAYRALAMRWHPDVNSGSDADARMKAINVAYAMVCQHLSALGRAGHAPSPATGFTEFDWKTGFKTAKQAAETKREECAQRTIHVSLFEAAFGCIKRVNGLEPHACLRCAGSGEFSGSWTLGSKCPHCFGRGKATAQDIASGKMYSACGSCLGSGVYKPVPPQCPDCKGSGKTQRRAWLVDVPIYAGTLDGAVIESRDIRVRSGAESLPRAFQFTVHIEKHPIFKLNRDRLSVVVPVSVWRWAMGGDLTVPTLDGSACVQMPAKPTVLLVKNQGWPEFKLPSQRKSLFVLPKIVYPEHLDQEELQLLQHLESRSRLPDVQGWERNLQAWVESSAQSSRS